MAGMAGVGMGRTMRMALRRQHKAAGMVDEIEKLTLLETADLVKELKQRLNIESVMNIGMGGGAPAAPVEEEKLAAPAVEEKTIFALSLQSFEAGQKAKVIKEVKALLGMNLVDAKKLVESAPKLLKEGVTKEDGEKIQKTLQDLGCKCSLD